MRLPTRLRCGSLSVCVPSVTVTRRGSRRDCPARSSDAHLAVHIGSSTGGSSALEKVIIGVDPHKLSATIEVVDDREQLLDSGRFTNDRAGYSAMRKYAATWRDRVWAVEGSNGAGRPLAQRLLEDGERVVDVPAKLAARVRLFDTATTARPTPTMHTPWRWSRSAPRPCECSSSTGSSRPCGCSPTVARP